VKPPKVPEPSPKREYKKVKRHLAAHEALVARIVQRFAARPIRVDKAEVKRFVEHELLPPLVTYLKRLPADRQVGTRAPFIEVSFEGAVEAVDGREVLDAIVQVGAQTSNGKGGAVGRGSAGKRQFEHGRSFVVIKLVINGTLSPREFLEPTGTGLFALDRMQPISSCTSEACLPFGLYSTLIHELTHAAESMYAGTPTYYRDGEFVDELYWNDPQEIRAFMQQIVDEGLRHAGQLREHAGNNQRLVELCLKLSTTWGVVGKKLTPANQNKMRKAMYTALDEAGLLF